ncbi:hypothetical protein GCM10028808_10460 [Spirosoma migulaei]
MDSQLSITQQLDRIRDVLAHAAMNCHEIERRVKSVFRSVKYAKHPIIVNVDRVIRATKHTDEAWFDGLSKFDYPPTSAISFGRCNQTGEQVFYCSNDNAIPIFEVRPKIGDYIALSRWAHKDESKRIGLYCVILGAQHLLDNLEEDDLFRRTLLQDVVFKPDTRPEIKELDAYVGNLFVKEAENYHNLYWFTSAVTKAYLDLTMIGVETHSKLDGIIYPSVAGKLKGYNIMLTKAFRDKNLLMTSVYVYQVQDISNNNDYSLLHLKSLKSVQGSLMIWETEPENSFFEFNPHIPGKIISRHE